MRPDARGAWAAAALTLFYHHRIAERGGFGVQRRGIVCIDELIVGRGLHFAGVHQVLKIEFVAARCTGADARARIIDTNILQPPLETAIFAKGSLGINQGIITAARIDIKFGIGGFDAGKM
jgi:hypothetical protein